MRVRAVSFDFGQTLAECSIDLLQTKCRELGAPVDAARLRRGVDFAFGAYDQLIAAGAYHPWEGFMRAVLTVAEVGSDDLIGELSHSLFVDQGPRNLWREPISGMIELARELKSLGVPLVVISNSEGHLVELIAELNWQDVLGTVFDSGVLQIAKPDPRIFGLAAEAIAVAPVDIVHIGDSVTADVEGALAAGFQAIAFLPPPMPVAPRERRLRELSVPVFSDAASLRKELLGRLGLRPL